MRGHIRSAKEARETLGLLTVGLAVGAGSGDPQKGLTVGTRNGAHHTEASQWARNGGSQWRRMRRVMIVPDLPQIWYETMSGSVADTWS